MNLWMTGIVFILLAPVFVPAVTLSIEPITWDIVGLDSNSPATAGPYRFPIGVRVTNEDPTTTSNSISVTWEWQSDNTPECIELRDDSMGTPGHPITLILAPDTSADVYFEIEIVRAASSHDKFRRYQITATESGIGGGTASTPTPRQVYVEKLVSQNRNYITSISLDGTTIPFGGSMNLLVGQTYDITLTGGTATGGYNQLETFINFPNTIFQINSVTTTYDVESTRVTNPWPNLYADACGWDADPSSPNYRSCIIDDDKAGGNTVTTVYNVTIISGGGTSETLHSLFHDFSGSSYHYNADFSSSFVIANIKTPTIAKKFTPKAILPDGTSVLTFTLTNPSSETLTDLNFTDSFWNEGGQRDGY